MKKVKLIEMKQRLYYGDKLAKVFILVDANIGKLRKVFEEIKKIEGITKANMVTGAYDVIALAETEEMTEITEKIVGKIREIDGVKTTNTSVVTE